MFSVDTSISNYSDIWLVSLARCPSGLSLINYLPFPISGNSDGTSGTFVEVVIILVPFSSRIRSWSKSDFWNNNQQMQNVKQHWLKQRYTPFTQCKLYKFEFIHLNAFSVSSAVEEFEIVVISSDIPTKIFARKYFSNFFDLIDLDYNMTN